MTQTSRVQGFFPGMFQAEKPAVSPGVRGLKGGRSYSAEPGLEALVPTRPCRLFTIRSSACAHLPMDRIISGG